MEMTPSSTIYKVVSTGIRTQLLTDATLVAKLTDNIVPETKLYLSAAHGKVQPPYVRYHHVYGGEPAKAPRREFDQLWLVCAIAFDQPVSMDIDAYLQNLMVGVKLPFIEGWEAYVPTTKNGEYSNLTNVQGQEIWEIGAYYRIRGVKGY